MAAGTNPQGRNEAAKSETQRAAAQDGSSTQKVKRKTRVSGVPDLANVGRPPINHAAIDLLRSWREADEEELREQQKTWEYLKRALDEDRDGSRKLFP